MLKQKTQIKAGKTNSSKPCRQTIITKKILVEDTKTSDWQDAARIRTLQNTANTERPYLILTGVSQ